MVLSEQWKRLEEELKSWVLVNSRLFPGKGAKNSNFRLIKGGRKCGAPGLLVKRDSSWTRVWVAEAIGR